MEDSVIDRLCRFHGPAEMDRQDQGSCSFKYSGSYDDLLRQPYDPACLHEVYALLECPSHPEPDLFSQDHGKEDADGHKSQSTDLDQADDHDLPECGPVLICICNDESCHTGSGHRREQCVHRRCHDTFPGRDREHQEQRSRKYDQAEPDHDHLRLCQTTNPFFHHAAPASCPSVISSIRCIRSSLLKKEIAPACLYSFLTARSLQIL